MRVFGNIETIDFRDNVFQKNDLDRIGDALKYNKCLKSIKMKRNGSEDRLKKLFEAELAKNAKIQALGEVLQGDKLSLENKNI